VGQPLDEVRRGFDRLEIGDLPCLNVRGLQTKARCLLMRPAVPNPKYKRYQRPWLAWRSDRHRRPDSLVAFRRCPGGPVCGSGRGRVPRCRVTLRLCTRRVWRTPVRRASWPG